MTTNQPITFGVHTSYITTAFICAAAEGHGKVVANLLEKGAEVDSSDKVRIDMYVSLMYRLGLLCVISLNFTQHINVDRTIDILMYVCADIVYHYICVICIASKMTSVCTYK